MTWLRILVVVSGFLIVGIALLPMRWAVTTLAPATTDLSIGSMSGSIWRGKLGGVSWNNEPLGDFDVRTRLAPLLSGRLRADFTSTGPLASGQISATRSSLMLLNLNGEVTLGRIASTAPPDARLRFTNAGIDLDGRRCRRAGGQANLTGLSSLSIDELSGPLSCEAGRVVLSLTPRGGGPTADFIVDAAAEGGPSVRARSRDAVMQAALSALGLAIEEYP